MKYWFYIYRDVFVPGPREDPEERIIETDDPERTAREMCKGAIDRVDWDEIKEATR